MSVPVELAAYDPEGPKRFSGVGRRLRLALGDLATRIDHVGATAVEGVPGQAIVDVQVSVPALSPEAVYREPLAGLGFAMEAGHADRTVRFFREAKAPGRVHVLVRAAGSLGEQATLLLRDYLRADAGAARAFAEQKQALADADDYEAAKHALLWTTLADAFRWAQATTWAPGTSDA